MTNFSGLPLEFQKIHEKCSYNPFFFLVVVSHSGLPRTNPYSSSIENCTQGTPDVKSSGLNHSATLPPFAANYEARVNAPLASSLSSFIFLATINITCLHYVTNTFTIVFCETQHYSSRSKSGTEKLVLSHHDF